MYYEPGKTPHGLPHDPFKSCVVPRPIGWISTVDALGRDNLAPYSQFQNVTFDPP
ncbi:MAG: flavin reductase family protein, partial [Hydrogenophaga sp.]